VHYMAHYNKYSELEMWANAQRDGRPAEYTGVHSTLCQRSSYMSLSMYYFRT